MDDLISRQAAIDAISNAFDRETILTRFLRSVALRAVRDLPSAQPEQLKAKWEWLSSTYDRIPREMRFQCSNCHHETITHESDPWEKYCPNCGAKMMRGE